MTTEFLLSKVIGCCDVYGKFVVPSLSATLVFNDDCRHHDMEEIDNLPLHLVDKSTGEFYIVDTHESSYVTYEWYMDGVLVSQEDVVEAYINQL